MHAHHSFSHIVDRDNTIFFSLIRLGEHHECFLDLILFLRCDAMLFSQLRLPGFRCGQLGGRGGTAFRRLGIVRYRTEIMSSVVCTIAELCANPRR
jgi:hypothetical protein